MGWCPGLTQRRMDMRKAESDDDDDDDQSYPCASGYTQNCHGNAQREVVRSLSGLLDLLENLGGHHDNSQFLNHS
ncbi:hypothetical protein PoB_006091300 [Plakobranchus ocellatus]|uniref:Uncharacterized protein n=1 Tax=Plakobranchus ocellatus TaxID=259542 RepID=A0AAV4CR65_9GAST|nr:hypothetical protein PoB_006091300 [Plakobranchus ocellatus]